MNLEGGDDFLELEEDFGEVGGAGGGVWVEGRGGGEVGQEFVAGVVGVGGVEAGGFGGGGIRFGN